MATAGMVHPFRQNGAWRPRAWCSGPPCVKLFRNALALAHGFALDLDGVGVVDDPVTDGVGQGGVVQVLVSLAGVVIVRVFAMRRAVNWRWSGLATTRWNASRWHTSTNLREKSSDI